MHTNICSPDNGGEPAQTHGLSIRSSGSLEVTFPEVIFPALSRARLSPAPARFSGTELFYKSKQVLFSALLFYINTIIPFCLRFVKRFFNEIFHFSGYVRYIFTSQCIAFSKISFPEVSMSPKAALSYRTPGSYEEAAELLWSLGDPYTVQVIGSSAGGKSIYALSVGAIHAPAIVYAGADLSTAALLLHFAFSLPSYLAKNATLHRIHLPTLLRHRRLCICPFLCPDTQTPLTNSLGVFLPDCFPLASLSGQEPIPVEKAPEASALRQFLTYTEPALFCLLRHCPTAVGAELHPTISHTPVDHLLSRLLSGRVESSAATPAFLSIPRWYTRETGHLAYGVTLSPEPPTLQPFLLTAPLLIHTSYGSIHSSCS